MKETEYAERFECIDKEMRSIDLHAFARQLAASPAGSLERLVTLYRAVRPMLRGITGFPLLLPGWRKVMKMFVATLDVVAVNIDPTFKAAKDV